MSMGFAHLCFDYAVYLLKLYINIQVLLHLEIGFTTDYERV